VSQPNVQARVANAIELGLQSDLDYELHVDQKIMQLVGEGPWNVEAQAVMYSYKFDDGDSTLQIKLRVVIGVLMVETSDDTASQKSDMESIA
jgi:phage-related baseplate assembly protein